MYLLLFAIKMAMSDLERYNVGLPEYVKIMRNIVGFQSKQFWPSYPISHVA